jgi:hypothetical protein
MTLKLEAVGFSEVLKKFLPYGRSIGSWMSYTQDIYMSHGTEYNRHAQHCNVVVLYIDRCLGVP